MIKEILFILIIFWSFAVAQDEPKEVRLDSEIESWLAADIDGTLKLLEEKAAAAKTADHVLFYNIGYLYALQGKNSRALKWLQKSIDINPNFPFAYKEIAKIYERSGNLFGAKTTIQRGLMKETDHKILHLELARLEALLKNWKSARKLYEEFLADHESNIEAITGLLQAYRNLGELLLAGELLKTVESLYPESNLLIEKYYYLRAIGDEKLAEEILLQLCLDYPKSDNLAYLRDTLRVRYKRDHLPVIDPVPEYNYRINPEESLNYTVEYGFVTLGWLKVRTREKQVIDGRTVYRVVFFVDSNPSFDFILSLHHIYESYIDERSFNAIRSRLYTPDDDEYIVRMYFCDYDENIFRAYKVWQDGHFELQVKDLPRMAQDGTSMLFYARGVLSQNTGGTTTVIINENYKLGHITYLDEFEEIEAGDKEYDAMKIFARADFEGIAGMSGDAWGWFTNDDQLIPIMGKLKILIGSITLELQ